MRDRDPIYPFTGKGCGLSLLTILIVWGGLALVLLVLFA